MTARGFAENDVSWPHKAFHSLATRPYLVIRRWVTTDSAVQFSRGNFQEALATCGRFLKKDYKFVSEAFS